MRNAVETDYEPIAVRLAKLTHASERIWAKIYKTEDHHACKWGELDEYHRELYLAGAELHLEILQSEGLIKRRRRGGKVTITC